MASSSARAALLVSSSTLVDDPLVVRLSILPLLQARPKEELVESRADTTFFKFTPLRTCKHTKRKKRRTQRKENVSPGKI